MIQHIRDQERRWNIIPFT